MHKSSEYPSVYGADSNVNEWVYKAMVYDLKTSNNYRLSFIDPILEMLE